MATLGTYGNPTSADALRGLWIKCTKSAGGGGGRCVGSISPISALEEEGNSDTEWGDIIQFDDGAGGIFPTKPTKAAKSRNKPGQGETAKRGAVTNFQGTPKGVRKPMVCIRCGDPSHFVKDCPHHYRPALNIKFSPILERIPPK